PFMASRFKQSPEAAENAKSRLAANLKVLDAAIGAKPFVAGERPTIADCTFFAALEFAEFSQAPIDPACKNVARWYRAFKERPSERWRDERRRALLTHCSGRRRRAAADRPRP